MSRGLFALLPAIWYLEKELRVTLRAFLVFHDYYFPSFMRGDKKETAWNESPNFLLSVSFSFCKNRNEFFLIDKQGTREANLVFDMIIVGWKEKSVHKDNTPSLIMGVNHFCFLFTHSKISEQSRSSLIDSSWVRGVKLDPYISESENIAAEKCFFFLLQRKSPVFFRPLEEKVIESWVGKVNFLGDWEREREKSAPEIRDSLSDSDIATLLTLHKMPRMTPSRKFEEKGNRERRPSSNSDFAKGN